jgi:hypothetical protein
MKRKPRTTPAIQLVAARLLAERDAHNKASQVALNYVNGALSLLDSNSVVRMPLERARGALETLKAVA